MAVMDTVLGFVADIGLDAAKERFKLKQQRNILVIFLTPYSMKLRDCLELI